MVSVDVKYHVYSLSPFSDKGASFLFGRCFPGHNCRIPPLPVPAQPDTVNTAVPILVSASRLLTFTVGDSSLVWNCTCAVSHSDNGIRPTHHDGEPVWPSGEALGW